MVLLLPASSKFIAVGSKGIARTVTAIDAMLSALDPFNNPDNV
jgi:hypothetical protein